MKLSEYFKTPIFYDLKPDFLNLLNFTDKYILEQKNSNIEKIKNRNKIYNKDLKDKGFHYHSTSLLNDNNFKDFHNFVLKKSYEILDTIGYDLTNYQLKYTESWVQEFSEKGCTYHKIHYHGNSHISGFYFLKSSYKTPKLYFLDPRTGHCTIKLPEKNEYDITYANDNIKWETEPGFLILFPSYLAHGFDVDYGIDPFRFIHINIKAIEKNLLT